MENQPKQTEAIQEDIILDEPKGALKKVCIKKAEHKGRAIYALETIQRGRFYISSLGLWLRMLEDYFHTNFIGTSIWQELPFSAVVDDQNISKACSSCFVNDKRMFKCSKCSFVHYCSKVSSNAFDYTAIENDG